MGNQGREDMVGQLQGSSNQAAVAVASGTGSPTLGIFGEQVPGQTM